MPKILRKLKEEQKARGCQKVHGGQKDEWGINSNQFLGWVEVKCQKNSELNHHSILQVHIV